MDWAGLPWNKAVVVVRGWGHLMQKKKKKQALFGTIPDFHRVQMLGVGDLW